MKEVRLLSAFGGQAPRQVGVRNDGGKQNGQWHTSILRQAQYKQAQCDSFKIEKSGSGRTFRNQNRIFTYFDRVLERKSPI